MSAVVITAFLAAGGARPDGRATARSRPDGRTAARSRPDGRTPARKLPRPAGRPVLFESMLSKIAGRYYEPGRLRYPEFVAAALQAMEPRVPELLVDRAEGNGSVTLTVGMERMTVETRDADSVGSVGAKLHKALLFVLRATDRRSENMKLQRAMFSAILETLDPYCRLFTPRVFVRLKEALKGYTVGVGAQLKRKEGRLVIARVVRGGPAHRAGLRPGDELFRVGSLLMADLTPYVADSALRGKPGTTVDVWILRRGWRRPRRFRLRRRQVILSSVESRMLNVSVGLIRVTDFKENTLEVFNRHARDLIKKGMKAMVVDLRGNGGGFVDVAVQMADHFVDRGVLLLGEGARASASKTWKARRKTTRYRMPVGVLVDRQSASAAEILAGALQEADRALILGERTWGKGTVQELEFTSDGGAYKFTTFQYLLAGRVPVQERGVTPDIQVARVSVRQNGFRVFRPQGVDREATVKGHLHAVGRKSIPGRAKPAFTLRIFHDRTRDNLVALTRDLLSAALKRRRWTKPSASGSGSGMRQALLSSGTSILKRAQRTHKRLIADRMKTAGIDWSSPPDATAAKTTGLKLKARLTTDSGKAPAGGRLKVNLTVKNLGTRPAFQIGGVTKCRRPYLNGRELVVGKVPPGQTRTASVEVPVPRDLVTHTTFFELELMTGERPAGLTLSRTVQIVGLPRPEFRFSWQLDDRRRAREKTGGNGDGVLQPGESADLTVVVKNVGGLTLEPLTDGSEPDPRLTLKRARVRLPPFGHGQVVQAKLRIALPAKLGTDKLPARLGLTVSVFDKYLGRKLWRRIEIPVSARGAPAVPITGTARPIVNETALMAAARRDSPVVARAARSTVFQVEARHGKWLRVRLGDGRPGFVPEAEVILSEQPRATIKRAKPRATIKRAKPRARPSPSAQKLVTGLTHEFSVKPPEIHFEPMKASIDAPGVTVKGKVSHWEGVNDLWVETWHLDTEPIRRDKILYRAVPVEKERAPLRHLEFKVNVDLKKGSNVITVEARNRNGVKAFKRVAVYRPMARVKPEGVLGVPATPDKPSKARKRASGKSSSGRCGCRNAPPSSPVWLLVLLVLAAYRRWKG